MTSLDILLLLVSIFTLVVIFTGLLAWSHRRQLRKIEPELGGNIRALRESVDTLVKLEKYNSAIVGLADVSKEWARIHERIKDFQSEFPDTSAYHRLANTMVNFYHRPLDATDESIRNGVINLLESHCHILYIYSSLESASFPRALKESIEAAGFPPDTISSNCFFQTMTPEEEMFPLNFSVVAPFLANRTLTYIHFPGDEMRDFALKIEAPTLLAGKMDRLALTHFAGINIEENENVTYIVESAKRELADRSGNIH